MVARAAVQIKRHADLADQRRHAPFFKLGRRLRFQFRELALMEPLDRAVAERRLQGRGVERAPRAEVAEEERDLVVPVRRVYVLRSLPQVGERAQF